MQTDIGPALSPFQPWTLSRHGVRCFREQIWLWIGIDNWFVCTGIFLRKAKNVPAVVRFYDKLQLGDLRTGRAAKKPHL